MPIYLLDEEIPEMTFIFKRNRGYEFPSKVCFVDDSSTQYMYIDSTIILRLFLDLPQENKRSKINTFGMKIGEVTSQEVSEKEVEGIFKLVHSNPNMLSWDEIESIPAGFIWYCTSVCTYYNNREAVIRIYHPTHGYTGPEKYYTYKTAEQQLQEEFA